jgi:hypothetical protein
MIVVDFLILDWVRKELTQGPHRTSLGVGWRWRHCVMVKEREGAAAGCGVENDDDDDDEYGWWMVDGGGGWLVVGGWWMVEWWMVDGGW